MRVQTRAACRATTHLSRLSCQSKRCPLVREVSPLRRPTPLEVGWRQSGPPLYYSPCGASMGSAVRARPVGREPRGHLGGQDSSSSHEAYHPRKFVSEFRPPYQRGPNGPQTACQSINRAADSIKQSSRDPARGPIIHVLTNRSYRASCPRPEAHHTFRISNRHMCLPIKPRGAGHTFSVEKIRWNATRRPDWSPLNTTVPEVPLEAQWGPFKPGLGAGYALGSSP
jgi:hypothetical protein